MCWNCHLENPADNPLILGSEKPISIENCKFCKDFIEEAVQHVHAICEKLVYLDDMVLEILQMPIMIRLMSWHPNAKEKLSCFVKNCEYSTLYVYVYGFKF